mmetsp:Transcript_29629/g.62297  ORF Transcript_29629/g.62297 Transcript_29629/m.62297 type:complete len:98 (+) Transcript_29629:1242-1535(+)
MVAVTLCHEREKSSDMVPQEDVNTIDAFHLTHNLMSPNAKDTVKRYVSGSRQIFGEARKIIRLETWQELWAHFKKYSPGIATRIMDPSNPSHFPTLL